MIKLFSIVKKNFLSLLRNKLSTFTIILGPLLIILMLGVSLSSPSNYNLQIGHFSPDNSSLSERFVDNMKEESLITKDFSSSDECVSNVKHGVIDVCVIFPSNFSIDNDKVNEITFLVDDSRTNFVYQIIDTISSSFSFESKELTQDLTNNIISTLYDSKAKSLESISKIILLKSDTSSSIDSLSSIKNRLGDIDLVSDKEVSFDASKSSFTDLFDEGSMFRDDVSSIISKGRSIVDTLESESYAGTVDVSSFDSALDDLSQASSNFNDVSDDLDDDFYSSFDSVESELEGVYSQISSADDIRNDVVSKITSLQSDISDINNKLESLKVDVESVVNLIDSLKITSGETISSPIVTKIEKISAESDKLMFTFPYLLMVIVLFVGLVLASSLVVLEKKSKSSFRIFVSPTGEYVFLIGNFITSFLIIFIQQIIIFSLAYFFMGEFLLSNLFVFSLVLALSTSFFILLGMVIGYLFNTQESTMIVSISLSSIFIFLSNLILPIETLSSSLQKYFLLNPYVLASESLRKVMVFNYSFTQIEPEFFTLGLMCAILIAFIFLISQITKTKLLLYLTLNRKNRITNPKETYLLLGSEYVKDLSDFLSWLKRIDDKTFNSDFQWSSFRKWLSHEKGYRNLRIKLAGKDRSKLIKILENRLKKLDSE